MAGTTTRGYPYPTGTDRVMDGDNAIQALAEATDTRAGTSATGQWTTLVTANATASVMVTLPAGRFTVPPVVQVTVNAGIPSAAGGYVAGWQGAATSATAVQINARRHADGTVSGSFYAVEI